MANFGLALVFGFLWVTFSGGCATIDLLLRHSWGVILGLRFWGTLAVLSFLFICCFVVYFGDRMARVIAHRRHYVHRRARQWIYRPRRYAQMPPPIVIPINIEVQLVNPQIMDFMPQQPNRMPQVQHQQCPQRNINLTKPRQRRNNRERELNIAEEGMGALPLRRSARIRAQKEAEARVAPLQAPRRSARIQAKKEAEQREAQQLRRNTRNRAY